MNGILTTSLKYCFSSLLLTVHVIRYMPHVFHFLQSILIRQSNIICIGHILIFLPQLFHLPVSENIILIWQHQPDALPPPQPRCDGPEQDNIKWDSQQVFPQFFVPPRAIRFCRQNFITVSLTTDDIWIGTSQLERKLQQDVENVKYKVIPWPSLFQLLAVSNQKTGGGKCLGLGLSYMAWEQDQHYSYVYLHCR